MSDVEWQIRDWYDYSWLSGDVTILASPITAGQTVPPRSVAMDSLGFLG